MELFIMDNKFKKGFVFGGIVGTLAALFASSKKGKQLTREIVKDVERLYDELKDKTVELSSLTRENYDNLVERLTDEFSVGKNWATDIKDKVVEELKNRYAEFQLLYFYSKLKARMRKSGELTRENFESSVDDLVDEYAEKKEIAVSKLRQVKRQLKSKWNDFKRDLDESDQE